MRLSFYQLDVLDICRQKGGTDHLSGAVSADKGIQGNLSGKR